MNKYYFLFLCLGLSFSLKAQTDLLNLLPDNDKPEPVSATFKSNRLINGYSIETTPANHLDYRISHRFGTLNSGAYQLFGLDQGYIYMGFEYGITNNWMVGIGRSSIQKLLNAYTKLKVLKQQTNGGTPISITLVGEAYSDMTRYDIAEKRTNVSKFSYTSQALIARKFNDRASLQVMPTWVHRNRNNVNGESNDVFAVGVGGRIKLTKRTAFVGEYYYVLPNQINQQYKNSLSFGFDIETGGHVFSLHLTNSTGMVAKQFIAENLDSWADGGIHFGFNLGRSFGLGKKHKNQYKVAQ